MTTANARSDYVKFLRSWMANPLKVSAVAPSGQSLARLMTAEISPGSGPVLDRLGLKATLVGRTVRNIPPAAVYRVTQVGAE